MDQIKRFFEAVTFVVVLAFLAGACSPSATEVPKEVPKKVKVAVLFSENTEIGIPDSYFFIDMVSRQLGESFTVYSPTLDGYFEPSADKDGVAGRGADFLVTGFVAEKFDHKVAEGFIMHRGTGVVRVVQMQGRKTLYETNIDVQAAEGREYRAAVATLKKVAHDFAPPVVAAIRLGSQ